MHAEWLLKRNCSLSPRQSAWVYGCLCAAMLGIGLAFTVRGAWMVLGFALVYIGALALALLHYTRHAADLERIALEDGCLLVERFDAGQVSAVRLDPCWTRVQEPDRKRPLIALESRGVTVLVGVYISEEAREKVALELKRELRTRSFLQSR